MPTIKQLHAQWEADFEFKLNQPLKPMRPITKGKVIGHVVWKDGDLHIEPLDTPAKDGMKEGG